ncbi:uncharacterized protein LOC135387904 [Ornithodoros turicata]|uniref:uncharacterized protein LOC135387904 n=1 Tax=Ornithodoros turicata TaxID=34597 RepID=UPI00313A497F
MVGGNNDEWQGYTVSLPFSSIYAYVNKQFETSRCLLEGEAVFEAGHVVECSVVHGNSVCTSFIALVLQTSALSKDPHQITVAIKERIVDRASCTCKAGNYRCKHIVAVLLHINTTKEFAVLSQTEMPQKWGKAQKQFVQESGSYQAKTREMPVLEDDVLDLLLKGLPYESAALLHRQEGPLPCLSSDSYAEAGCIQTHHAPLPRTIKEVVRHLYEAQQKDGTTAVDIGAIYSQLKDLYTDDDLSAIEELTRQQSACKLWKNYRIGLITASISYSVYTRVRTLQTKCGPHDVRSLLKTIMRTQTVQTPAMKRGLQLECTAKKQYLNQQSNHGDLEIKECGLFILKDYPFIAATPDGLVKCKCCAPRTLEIKCPSSVAAFRKVHMLQREDNALKRTSHYYAQVQLQMGITNTKSADVFVYESPEVHLLFNVQFDIEFFNDAIQRFQYFFRGYVLPCLFTPQSCDFM